MPDFRNKTFLNIMNHEKILAAANTLAKQKDYGTHSAAALHTQPVGFSLQIHSASHYCPSRGLQRQDRLHLSSVSLALRFLMRLD